MTSPKSASTLLTETELLQTMDGAVWAKEFMSRFGHQKQVIDESLMLSWFCNAIMVGFDHASRRTITSGRASTLSAAPQEKTMKLDAKFTGKIRKVKDGSIVPDDEYVVFIAKDNAFFDSVPYYLLRCMKRGCDREQIDAVYRMYWRIREWRAAHPERLKNPDAKGERLLDYEPAD